MPKSRTIDADELRKFSAMAAEWWNPHGKFRPLHKFNPLRLTYIRDALCAHFARDTAAPRPLDGLHLLDIGCGGGLICEPMARLGARVVGADASRENIETARLHAAAQGLDIDYRATHIETLAAEQARFDIILNMEVLEHVASVPIFLASCAQLLTPNGIMVFATLNRTRKAYLFAILGAEYILRWLPRGTHDWHKFVTPTELRAALAAGGLEIARLDGVSFNPLRDEWQLSGDLAVNYIGTARHAES